MVTSYFGQISSTNSRVAPLDEFHLQMLSRVPKKWQSSRFVAKKLTKSGAIWSRQRGCGPVLSRAGRGFDSLRDHLESCALWTWCNKFGQQEDYSLTNCTSGRSPEFFPLLNGELLSRNFVSWQFASWHRYELAPWRESLPTSTTSAHYAILYNVKPRSSICIVFTHTMHLGLLRYSISLRSCSLQIVFGILHPGFNAFRHGCQHQQPRHIMLSCVMFNLVHQSALCLPTQCTSDYCAIRYLCAVVRCKLFLAFCILASMHSGMVANINNLGTLCYPV